MADEIRIYRHKHFKTGQIGYAWNWNYIVKSPNEFDAGCFTLDEAQGIAKRRNLKTGLPIICDWR
jgi:hypothetical protein